MRGRGDLIDLVPKGGSVIEVGVNEGHNLADWQARRPDLIYCGVDSWDGRFAPAKELAYARCRPSDPYSNRAHLVQKESLEAAKASRVLWDLIYIDANHEYDSVKADIEAWWPLVKPGGILAGHDYENKLPEDGWEAIEVKKAVDEWVAKNGLKLNVIDEPAPSWWVRKEA